MDRPASKIGDSRQRVSSQRRAQLIGIALTNVATLTWATNMTLGRWLRDDIGPLTLAASRFCIASILFTMLLQRRPVEERRLGMDRRWLMAMGLTGIVFFAPTLYLGLHFTTTVNATLINGLGPLITGLLAALLIQEPMSRRQIAGAVIGLAGVLFLISGGSLALWRSMTVNVGDLIMVGAVALWSLYSVLGRRVMRHRPAISATALSTFMALPLLLIVAAWEISSRGVNLSPQLLAAILYIGVVPTVVGFLTWNEGVRRLGSSGAMVFYNTLPLYGAVLGVMLLGEKIGWSHLIGGALIIGGGLYAARGQRQ
jgi:drug/metabolite transporter (DMT)-like permease